MAEAATAERHTENPDAGPLELDSEVVILAAALSRPEYLPTIRTVLTGSEFLHLQDRVVFRAILAVADQGEPVDPVSVFQRLEADGKAEEAGGVEYLVDISGFDPGEGFEENIRHHAGVVVAEAHRRNLHSRLQNIVLDLQDPRCKADEVRSRIYNLVELSENGAGGHNLLPSPRTVDDILSEPEPEFSWIAGGVIPAGGNVLIAGYPKSHKTHFHMELAVAAATATPFLGHFDVGGEHRTGLVLMEGGEREQARRVERLALGRGLARKGLDESVYIWHRPPLRFSEPAVMAELAAHVEKYELDILVVDAWAYVATGNSNDSDEVTPQLLAFSRLRDRCPNLTTILIHHARKATPDASGNRLTDLVRNSSAFGGWYDCGIVLARKDETSPVTVRAELRDHPAPDTFAFTVDDQEPATSSNDWTAQGWLKLQCSDLAPRTLERQHAAEAIMPSVLDFLKEHPNGCSKNQVRKGVRGDNLAIEAAVDLMENRGFVTISEPAGPGKGSRIVLTGLHMI